MAKRILVVDDNPDTVSILTTTLKREGYGVSVAKNGLEAIEKATREIPALILLDLMLPKMDGLEVCKAVKENTTTNLIPILILTAKKDAASQQRGLELGASEYLLKPIVPAEIVRKVRQYLGDTPPPSSSVAPILWFPFFFRWWSCRTQTI